jgi:hypothetical protein
MDNKAVNGICFAVAPEPGAAESPAFEVLKAGTFKHPNFGEIDVTSEDLDKAVENFNAWKEGGVEVPIDYDHSFRLRGESKAAGWVSSLERKDNSLFAQVKWTKDAAEQIRSGAYRFFSPEFSSDFQDEKGDGKGFTVVSGGLTNRPFLRGLTPVALSEDIKDAAATWLAEAAASIGMGANDNPGDVAEAKDDKNKGPGTQPPKAPGGEGEPGTKEPEAQEEKTVALSETDFTQLTESAKQLKSFQERLETTEKQLTDERFTRIFSQAQREGRVDAKDETRDKWRERVDKFGFDEVESLIFDLPAETIPVKERGGAGENLDVEVGDDTDLERAQLDAKIRKRAEADSITYSEAFEKELEAMN